MWSSCHLHVSSGSEWIRLVGKVHHVFVLELCQQWLRLGVTGLASVSLHWMVALLQNSEPWAVWLIRNTRSALDAPWTLSQFFFLSQSFLSASMWLTAGSACVFLSRGRHVWRGGSPVWKLITWMSKLQFMCMSYFLLLGVLVFFWGIHFLVGRRCNLTNYVRLCESDGRGGGWRPLCTSFD